MTGPTITEAEMAADAAAIRAPLHKTMSFGPLMEEWGIEQAELDAVPNAEGEPYLSHAAFLQRDPKEASYARSVGMDGCTGTLRFQEHALRGSRGWVRCDGCRFDHIFKLETLSPDELRDQRWERANLPSLFAGRPFEQTGDSATYRAVVRDWLRVPSIPALALYGKPSRGKSHLLCSTAEVLLERGHDVLFWRVRALFDALQKEIGAEDRVWERARTVELLVLDDIGSERLTDWRRDRLDALVDDRYCAQLPILLSTNFAPNDWADVFGHRTAERLRGMTIPVEVEGRNWRQTTPTPA